MRPDAHIGTKDRKTAPVVADGPRLTTRRRRSRRFPPRPTCSRPAHTRDPEVVHSPGHSGRAVRRPPSHAENSVPSPVTGGAVGRSLSSIRRGFLTSGSFAGMPESPTGFRTLAEHAADLRRRLPGPEDRRRSAVLRPERQDRRTAARPPPAAPASRSAARRRPPRATRVRAADCPRTPSCPAALGSIAGPNGLAADQVAAGAMTAVNSNGGGEGRPHPAGTLFSRRDATATTSGHPGLPAAADRVLM
jgi:hypothetical protein